jgi:hypothetical protein
MAGSQDQLSAPGILSELPKDVEVRCNDPSTLSGTDTLQEELDEVALIDPVQGQAHDRRLLAPERRAEPARQALYLVFTEVRELG